MALREAIIATVILGLTTAGGAHAGPAKAGSTKAGSTKAEPTKAEPTKAEPTTAEPTKAAPAEADAEADADTAADADGSGSDAQDEAAMPPHLVGPRHVELGNGASIDLPAGMVLFERAVAQDLLRKGGEPAEGVVAIVFKPESSWHVSIEYAGSGYIDDSDADDLDAGDLLESYRKGTEDQNKIRKSLGKAELVIDAWSEAPHYERAVHHLAWGIVAHSVEGKVINSITRVLGRNGFLSVDLIDAADRIEGSKKDALAMLQAIHFNPGSTYADHVSSDRSSGIGLRGLVLGGAGVAVASKLGLLAKLLLVFKKLFIVIAAALAGLFRWLFRRKPRAAAADPLASRGEPDPGSPSPAAGPSPDEPPASEPPGAGSGPAAS